MAARYPRRQAARVSELLLKSFLPGLTFLEGRPRSGRTDFLLQLFDGLRESAGPAPVFLPLGGRPLDAESAAQALAQWLAFCDRRLASPLMALDREALLDRADFEAWQPLLAACETPFSPSRFLTALALAAGQRGPLCLLLDDPTPALLDSIALLNSPVLAVIAAANRRPPAGARLLKLEPFSTREALLLAESLARSMKVPFSGAAAEPFAACLAGDAFAIEATMRSAALRGEALDSEMSFIRAYGRDCADGSLAALFSERIPGPPGTPARRFAVQLLAAAAENAPAGAGWLADEAWLSRWRHRAPVDDVLEAFAALGCAQACSQGWLLRAWPAAQHWALLQTLDSLSGRGTLAVRLAAEVRAATARAHAAERRKRIEKCLLALPAGAEFRDAACKPGDRTAADEIDLKLPEEICEVASEPVDGGDLFLCFGLASPERPALLTIVLVNATADFARLLPLLEARVQAMSLGRFLPPGTEPCVFEKWLVLETHVPGTELSRFNLALGQRGQAVWKPVPFERFSQLIAGPAPAAAAPQGSEITLSLPAQREIELAAVRVLEQLAEREHWSETFVSHASMALVEACLNAVEQARAQPEPDSARIEVRISSDGGELVMSVSNPGAPFDPGEVQAGGGPPGAALNRGHGLKIIRSFVDDVRFFADLKGTRIEMRKRVAGSQGHSSAGEQSTMNAALSGEASLREDQNAASTKRD